MEAVNEWIECVNDVFWTYILIGLLIGCALWFTIKSRFVQFRMLPEMIRLLGESAGKTDNNKKQISSFQAFTVSLATRVGTGNLAGVASAIAVGGPGAVFWMWIIALFGSASAFVESTLAQLYKVKSKDSFIGGPAYYMERGLGKRWMGIIFAVLITFTFGFAFNIVQSNTICEAFEQAFNVNHVHIGFILTALTLTIIFGGIHRIARVSSIIVPFMAIGYVIIAFIVVIMNIQLIPGVIAHIVSCAMGFDQVAGGMVGAALMQGIRRGLFSNEAGEGSAPNAAATADISHPVKQGLIQALGVFTDTLLICSCTAFIILCSGMYKNPDLNGIQLTQQSLTHEIGASGNIIIAIAILFFAFSSIIGNYYYGEANLRFISNKRWIIPVYRIIVCFMVLFGGMTTLSTAWGFADITMGLMTLCNLIAIAFLSHQAFALLRDYRSQKKAGVKNPVFKKDRLPELNGDIECW